MMSLLLDTHAFLWFIVDSHRLSAKAAARLPSRPRVLNLEPSYLSDIFDDIERVAQAIGCKERGGAVVAGLKQRVERARERAALAPRRIPCFLMEWVDPPYGSGHWGTEIVEIAGGEDRLGRRGSESVRVPWPQIIDFAPEVMVVAACGYTVDRALQDLPILQARPEWDRIPAVRAGRVYVANGSGYFSRPGPRIVDSLEILAEALHPELFAGWFPDRGVVRLKPPIENLVFGADERSAAGGKAI